MKLKDLKVGEEYAFAAPNSYDAKHPKRVRIVKIGVYGAGPQSSFYASASPHPNHVEFEAMNDGYISHGFELNLTADDRPRHYRSDKPIVRTAFRGPCKNFLMLWSEHEAAEVVAAEWREKHAKRDREDKEHRDSIVARLNALGIEGSFGYHSGIEFSVEQAEQLLEILK